MSNESMNYAQPSLGKFLNPERPRYLGLKFA